MIRSIGPMRNTDDDVVKLDDSVCTMCECGDGECEPGEDSCLACFDVEVAGFIRVGESWETAGFLALGRSMGVIA